MKILVTGGTGTLGRIVVRLLRADGHVVRVLSRSQAPGVVSGDLRRNTGLEEAVEGVNAIVHCATGRADARCTRNLLDAARAAGTPHIVYISIVGVDRIPLFYYRQKLRAEGSVAGCGLPFTILRATQFHDLIAGVFDAQRKLPVLLVPDVTVQPVEVAEVAERLAEFAGGEPAGRVPDFGGPEARPAREFAALWQRGRRRQRVFQVRLPGGTFRALRAGFNLAPASGMGTFEDFLARRTGR